jgi:hypothetical protein
MTKLAYIYIFLYLQINNEKQKLFINAIKCLHTRVRLCEKETVADVELKSWKTRGSFMLHICTRWRWAKL